MESSECEHGEDRGGIIWADNKVRENLDFELESIL